MIRLEHLSLSFGSKQVLRDVDLTVRDGEVVGIIGSSGSGKSLLLRCMLMLNRPDAGKVFLDDTELTDRATDLNLARKKIGIVFQNFHLFRHMSVIENVMSGQVDLQNVDPQTAYADSMALLKTVGMADKAFASPSLLSGGQQQRAAIARTLAMKPEIVLFDEPTSALDPLMRGEVESVIRMLAAQGHTMVIVTHEMDLVRDVCTRVVFMDRGAVCEEGTPDAIFDTPQKLETKRFVQALRVLEFNVESKDFDFIGTQTALAEFAYRNGVPSPLLHRMQSIMEELFDMVIIQPEEQHKMHISFEYDRKNNQIEGVVRFSGPKVDPDAPMYFFSWPIIVLRASEVRIEDIEEDGYTNRVWLTIAQQ